MANKVLLSPDQISEKWGRRLKGAVSDVVAGIAGVTEAPGAKAASKQDKMRQRLLESIDNGTWAKNIRAVPLDEWKTKTTAKVKERMAGGVDAAMPKRQKFDQWMVARLNSILPEIAAMPDLTLEDSINRAGAMIRRMSEAKYKAS